MREQGNTMQDTELDLLTNAGTCRGCGQRRVLCAHGQCPACHTARRADTSLAPLPPAVHLCCGWWGALEALPWTCLTCGRVRRR